MQPWAVRLQLQKERALCSVRAGGGGAVPATRGPHRPATCGFQPARRRFSWCKWQASFPTQPWSEIYHRRGVPTPSERVFVHGEVAPRRPALQSGGGALPAGAPPRPRLWAPFSSPDSGVRHAGTITRCHTWWAGSVAQSPSRWWARGWGTGQATPPAWLRFSRGGPPTPSASPSFYLIHRPGRQPGPVGA